MTGCFLVEVAGGLAIKNKPRLIYEGTEDSDSVLAFV